MLPCTTGSRIRNALSGALHWNSARGTGVIDGIMKSLDVDPDKVLEYDRAHSNPEPRKAKVHQLAKSTLAGGYTPCELCFVIDTVLRVAAWGAESV